MMMSALLLTALAGAGMLRSFEARAARDMEARARSAGAHFAQWFRAAHHLTQARDPQYRSLIALHGGISLPSDSLRDSGLLPAWMPSRTDAGQELSLGIIDDGRGVPMAFAVATPTRPLSPRYLESFVAGAVENRVGDVAGPHRESRATRWREAIERVLGRTLQAGELFATADAGIAYDRRVVYRREQPGRFGQTRMETPLFFADGAGISGVDELDSLGAELVDGLTVGSLQVPDMIVAGNASVSGEVGAHQGKGGDVTIHASLGASSFRADEVAVGHLMVETELASRNAQSTGEVTALGNTLIDGDLNAAETRSNELESERLEAWNAAAELDVSGRIGAYSSTGEHAEIDGPVIVTGGCAGC